jgi:tetratricopeptide (TPR) repeat protein
MYGSNKDGERQTKFLSLGIFSIEFPPRWDLKKEVGDAFLRLGVAATAQRIFEELEMWEQVVTCYRVMDKMRQAEELVRARLAAAPTPDLWTALGEITGDLSCYETAWTLSKQRFGRAQRLWGFTLLRQGKWAECIPHLELALALNPLYHSAWFGLGSAALRVDDWERAQR